MRSQFSNRNMADFSPCVIVILSISFGCLFFHIFAALIPRLLFDQLYIATAYISML